jgi:hypothetical protein
VKGQWILAAGLLAVTSLSGVSADQAAFQKAVMATDGLVGYWNWEGSLADLSGNKNDGVAKGDAAAITYSDGINGGKALHIENPNDEGNFVDVPAPIGSVFDQQKFSIVTFARLDLIHDPSSGDWNDVMERNSLWYLSFEPVDDLAGSLGSRFVVRLYSADDPTGEGTDQIKDDAFFTRKGAWHAYAFTYDPTLDHDNLVMYMDGVKAITADYQGAVGPTADTPADSPHDNYDLSFGAWQQRGDWFTGDIDDSAYFKRVLTADEVKGLTDAMMAKAPAPAQ